MLIISLQPREAIGSQMDDNAVNCVAELLTYKESLEKL